MSEVLSSRFLLFVAAALVALSPLAMDSYLPAIPALADYLGVSAGAVSWTVSNFLLGLSAGHLIGGAISDQKGRRPVVLFGLILFAVSSLALVFITSLWAANGWRLLQGFSGGVVMVSSVAMVKDITPPERLAAQIAQIIFVVMLTPIVAPIIGASMLPLGWQSIFLLSLAAGLLMLVLVWGWVPESNSRISGTLSLTGALAQYGYVIRFQRDGVHIARLQALSLSCSALLGLIFVTASGPIIMDEYGLAPAQFPYAFGAFAVSILVGNRIGKWLIGRFPAHEIFRRGVWVQLLAIFSLLLLLCFVHPPLWLALALMMVAFGTGAAIGPSGSAMFLNLLEKHFGSAAAFETTLRFSLGALLGSLATALPIGHLLATTIIMFLSLLLSLWCSSLTRRFW